MEVVTGESCGFRASFQIVHILPNTATFWLVKTEYPSGHFLMEPEEK